MILCANPSAQFKSYQGEIEKAVLTVIRGNRYVLGEEVLSLEQEFADYIGTTAAMLVGTSAPETYSKFGLHLRRLARIRHACWYTSAAMLVGTCWKKISQCLSAAFGAPWH